MEKFKDPRRILHCKTMHGIIFTILYRALLDPELPEQVLSFCVYLLDMAVRFPSSNSSPNKCQQSEPKEVDDLKYKEWFDSSDTLQNTMKVIDGVAITEKVVMSMRMVEEMEIDEESEEDVEMGLESYAVYDVHSPIAEEDFQSPSQPLSLPPTTQLALPSAATSSSTSSTVVPFSAAPSVEPSTSSPSTSGPPVTLESALQRFASAINMALIPTSEGPTTVRPKCMKLKQVPGRHRMLLSDKGLPLAVGYSEPSDIFSGEQRYRSFSNKKTRSINESMLSILIQLHAKLSGRPDSYKPKETKPSDRECSRIGDGAVFVERLLDYVAFTGEEKMAAIQSVRQKLWPPIKVMDETVSTSNSGRSVDREERRQRAKERQQKLMAEFASKQKAFLQKTMETDCREEASAFDEPAPEVKKEYECVICSQMSPSEEERPVGMVVLLQATSVAGHYHENCIRMLPCDDEDRTELQKGKNVAAIHKNKIEILVRLFDGRHWPMALNIGWEGGVYVQTCGHYLHVDCHKAYIQSLKNQSQLSSRLQNLSVDNGEYYCPLCRQLANSVIPLSPDYKEASAMIQFPVKHLKVLAAEIAELLSSPLSERDSNLLKKYMGGVMEDMTNATYPQYRSVCSPNPSNLFLFVCSIVRTNLEIELIQRGTLLKALRKKSCFVPLLNVLSLHSSLLSQTMDKNERMDYALKVWSRLTGHFSLNRYALALLADDVPLLFRDPIAVLLQIILALPMNLDKGYFRCVIQVIFNFLFIQSLVQLSCHLKSYQRNEVKLESIQQMKDGKNLKEADKKNIKVLLGYVVRTFECSPLYMEDDEMSFSENVIDDTDVRTLDHHLQKYCLHFLKIAALIQSHLYEDSIHIKAEDDIFPTLCQYLGLAAESTAELTISSCINWITSDSRLTITTWCEDLLFFVNSSVVAARELLQKNIELNSPSLLELPHNYDEVFKYYHKKSCTVCHTQPKDPSLCLVCGTMVCLRENCCRNSQNEAVSHSVSCGAGTAIYLAVNSSTIIVIRGKRACLWGSVYLDSFGEEDRDLKRGKPLFLSKERYSLLKQQWLNHSFDHTSKRWVWHKDNL